MTSHHEELAARFVERLLAQGPESVLDVGCGAGSVVDRCRAAGVFAVGVEADVERLRGGTRRALADANQLPFGAGAFDWVTLRHVPHHLRDPRAALHEAWRVARGGVLVAEPWFDSQEPTQALAAGLDRWLKRRDRERGMFHAENNTGADLLALLPTVPARASIETYTALRARTSEEVDALVQASVGAHGVSADEKDELKGYRVAAARGGLSWNGTLIVCAHKP